MGRRYAAGVTNMTEGGATDGVFLPALALPIANTTGLSAHLDMVTIGPAVEAAADINMILKLSIVSLAVHGALTAGTNIPDMGAGAGLAVAVDYKNSRPAVVGASSGIQYAFNNAPSARLWQLPPFPFNLKYGLILDNRDLEDVNWDHNQALLLELLHGSGSAAKKVNVGAIWKE